MSDSSCWGMFQGCFAKATEEFSALVSPFKILPNHEILRPFKQIYTSIGWSE